MTDYFCGPGGNNGNAGTSWATRRLTIAGSQALLAAGDRLVIGPGVYRETLTINRAGSSGNPITLYGDTSGALTDGTGGLVEWTGSDTDLVAARAYCVDARGGYDYWTLQNIAFDTVSDTCVRGTACVGWEIVDCAFETPGTGQIWFDESPAGAANYFHRLWMCFAMNYAIIVESVTTVAVNDVIENVIDFSPNNFILVNVQSGTTVRNGTQMTTNGSGVWSQNLTTGVTTVRNYIITDTENDSLHSDSTARYSENYNALYAANIPRANVTAGANSVAYPICFESPNWAASEPGLIWRPYMLAEYSQLRARGTTGATDDFWGVTRSVSDIGAVSYAPPDPPNQVGGTLSYTGTGGFVVGGDSATAGHLAGAQWESYGTIAYSAASGTTVAPAYPTGIQAGDALVLFVHQKPSTANSGTVTTPSGWTLLGSLTGAGGYSTTLGADTGNTNLFVYTKDSVTGSESGTLSVTIGTNSVSAAQIHRVSRQYPTSTWSYAMATGSKTAAGASVSITMDADPGVQARDVCVVYFGIATDVSTPSQFSAEGFAQTGITFSSVTEANEPDTGNGNDLGGVVCYARATVGTSSAAPVFAATAGGTNTNVRGPAMFVRVRELSISTATGETTESAATDAGTGTAIVDPSGTGGDIASVTDSGTGVMPVFASGSDTSEAVADSGTGVMPVFASGSDIADATADSGAGTAPTFGSGSDSVGATSDAGTGIAPALASGGDTTPSATDAGTGALQGGGGSGSDTAATAVDSGAGTAPAAGAGSDTSAAAVDAGGATIPSASGSGADTSAVAIDAGAATIPSGGATGADTADVATDAGTAVAPASGTGTDAATATDAGGATAPAAASGGDTATVIDAGLSGTPAASGVGGDVVSVVDEGAGTIPSAAGSGADTAATATDGGLGRVPVVASGGDIAAPAVDAGTAVLPATGGVGGDTAGPAVEAGVGNAPALASGGDTTSATDAGTGRMPVVASGGDIADAATDAGAAGTSVAHGTGGDTAQAVDSGAGTAPAAGAGSDIAQGATDIGGAAPAAAAGQDIADNAIDVGEARSVATPPSRQIFSDGRSSRVVLAGGSRASFVQLPTEILDYRVDWSGKIHDESIVDVSWSLEGSGAICTDPDRAPTNSQVFIRDLPQWTKAIVHAVATTSAARRHECTFVVLGVQPLGHAFPQRSQEILDYQKAWGADLGPGETLLNVSWSSDVPGVICTDPGQTPVHTGTAATVYVRSIPPGRRVRMRAVAPTSEHRTLECQFLIDGVTP